MIFELLPTASATMPYHRYLFDAENAEAFISRRTYFERQHPEILSESTAARFLFNDSPCEPSCCGESREHRPGSSIRKRNIHFFVKM